MGRKDIFVGFSNYKELFSDPVFWVALKNTLSVVKDHGLADAFKLLDGYKDRKSVV